MDKGLSKPFVGEFEFDQQALKCLEASVITRPTVELLPDVGEITMLAHALLADEECAALRELVLCQDWVPVGRNGMSSNELEAGREEVGSYRVSCYSADFADVLWQRLQPIVPATRYMQDTSPTDWDGTRIWNAVGINPLMRFIRYETGGALVPHYDAPYILNNNQRTLMSVVLYLAKDSGVIGGDTRFITDPQTCLPLSQRDYADWTALADEKNVVARVEPLAGSALVFDHRILHDSQPVIGIGEKLLLRTDIIFERAT